MLYTIYRHFFHHVWCFVFTHLEIWTSFPRTRLTSGKLINVSVSVNTLSLHLPPQLCFLARLTVDHLFIILINFSSFCSTWKEGRLYFFLWKMYIPTSLFLFSLLDLSLAMIYRLSSLNISFLSCKLFFEKMYIITQNTSVYAHLNFHLCRKIHWIE